MLFLVLQFGLRVMKINRQVFLLTGSNIGSREEYLSVASDEIGLKIGKILKCSSIYESEPWGFIAEKNFLNQVLLVSTGFSALDILNKIQLIEHAFGRIRNGFKYLSRTIDIDILYFNNEIIQLPNLVVPHPHLHERRFALQPLAEIAPAFIHPLLKKTNEELLKNVSDPNLVWKAAEVQNLENV